MKIYWLDFEASSLTVHSYPIEVGWISEDGIGESHLIKPAPQWNDWSMASQGVHGITRDLLQSEGRPVREVALRMLDVLGKPDVLIYSDAPAFERAWLHDLMLAAEIKWLPMIHDSSELLGEAMSGLVDRLKFDKPPAAPDDAEQWIMTTAQEIVAAAVETELGRPNRVRHRALADVESHRRIWMDVHRLVAEAARRDATPSRGPADG